MDENKYEVLTNTLLDYFPTVDDPAEDRTHILISSFRSDPTQARYIGLIPQIEEVIQAPSSYLETAQQVLGLAVDARQLREYMVDLHDLLTGEDPEIAEAKSDPAKLFTYYAQERVRIPGTNTMSPPLWVVGVSTLALGAVLSFVYPNIEHIPVLGPIILAVLVLDAIVMLGSAAIMYTLRDTVVNDDRRREKELIRQEKARVKELQKSSRKSRILGK